MNQKGFTMIELVVVIIILGILAAVAVPKFVDLKAEAQAAALDGVVGNIASASAVNFAARSANPAKGVATHAAPAMTCEDAIEALLDGGIPTGYTIAVGNMNAGATSCTVNQTGGGSKPVTVLGIL